MASFETKTLLQGLRADMQSVTARAEALGRFSDQQLNTPPAPGKWSMAQVLAHLNSYHRYYLPEMRKALQRAEGRPASATFVAGWLGNYFTKLMKPGPGGQIANKMQAPKDYRPAAVLDARKVLSEFLEHQRELLRQLDEAEQTALAAVRVPISISRFIRLKLGDTYRFNAAHIQRHFVQIEHIIAAL